MKNAVAEIGKHSNMLPRNRGITLPLINKNGENVTVIRLIYFVKAIPGKDSLITPPRYLATYNWTKKKFISLEKLDESDTDKELPIKSPHFESADDIIPEYEKIWKLYDVLIPHFITNNTDIDDHTKQAAQTYLQYLDRHQEAPLKSHYEQHGGRFINFVKQCAGQK